MWSSDGSPKKRKFALYVYNSKYRSTEYKMCVGMEICIKSLKSFKYVSIVSMQVQVFANLIVWKYVLVCKYVRKYVSM